MNRLTAVRTAVFTVAVVAALVISAAAADLMIATLQPATVKAWDKYYGWVDRRVERELADSRRFLIEDFLPEKDRSAIQQEMNRGSVVIRNVPPGAVVPAGERFEIPDGDIHHLWGAVLVPRTRLSALLPVLQDYGHHAGKFADVEQSRLLSKEGDRFRFFFRLRRTKSIVTAYYNTEQECAYRRHGPTRVSSRSVATRIAEVEDPGMPSESERPPGIDRGFLWRLVSWWRFQETDAGVIVECESASLSRDVPAVVNWLPPIRNYIRSTPRESLESVLLTIRQQCAAK